MRDIYVNNGRIISFKVEKNRSIKIKSISHSFFCFFLFQIRFNLPDLFVFIPLKFCF